MRMKGQYFLVNHQLKGEAYRKSLLRVGYYPISSRKRASFLLTDRDVTKPAQHMIEEICERGHGACILYPHSASPPTVRWNGMYTPHPAISVVFVSAPGHKEIMQCYGFPHRVEVAGWSYSELREFTPSKELKKVLFAPIHPNHNGWLSDEDKELNRRTFEVLHYLSINLGFQLKVRYLMFLHQNGLGRVDGVEYVRGIPDLTIKEIEESDLIVSHETFAYLSVALGKPTLMMGEDVAPRLGHSPQLYKHAEDWDSYKHIMMYPLDILNTPDPQCLINKALISDESIREWKQRMIGTPFNSDFVNQTIMEYL